jgi:hypothetical protein
MSEKPKTMRTEIPNLPAFAELSAEQLQLVEGGALPEGPGPANPSFHYPPGTLVDPDYRMAVNAIRGW